MVCTDADKLFNGSIVSWRYGSKKVFLVRKTEDSLLNAGFELTLTAGSQVVKLTEGDGLTKVVDNANKQEWSALISPTHKATLLNNSATDVLVNWEAASIIGGVKIAGDDDTDFTGSFTITAPTAAVEATLNIDSTAVFVSAAIGNDSFADGTVGNYYAPYATISAAISEASDGDTIIVRNTADGTNSTFREECDLGGKRLTIRAESTDRPLPRVTTADVLTNANFSDASSNAWTISISHTITAIESFPIVIEDDELLTYVADVATCQTTAGSYTYTGHDNVNANSAATIPLYIHASDSSDVRTNGKVYECGVRQYAFHNAGDGSIVDGFQIDTATGDNGALYFTARGTIVRNCLFKFGNSHFAQIGSGIFENCAFYKDHIANDSRIPSSTPAVIFKSSNDEPALNAYLGCVVDSPNTLSTGASFFCHASNGTDDLKKLLVKDCYALNGTRGVQADDCEELDIQDCYFDGYVQVVLSGHESIEVDGLMAINGGTDGYIVRNNLNSATANTTVRNAVVGSLTSVDTALFWGRNGITTVRNVTTTQLDNEPVVKYHTGSFAFSLPDIRNSILQGDGNLYEAVNTGDFITADNNILWDSTDSTPSVLIDNVQYNGLTNWNSLGKALLDDNSYQEDPQFSGNILQGDLSRSGGTGVGSIGSNRSITPPNWTAMRTQWDKRILALPRGPIGGSRIRYF